MRTRIAFGTLLTLLTAGVFYGDHVLGPPYPFLGLLALGLAVLGTLELVYMLPATRRPSAVLVMLGVIVVINGHWSAAHFGLGRAVAGFFGLIGFVLMTLVTFVVEMRRFREPGHAVARIALTMFCIAYLGLLAGFFVDLRFFQPNAATATWSLVLAVFVPKGCDIGAYFTGSWIGKHKMTPTLSPKKTWEGAAGGLLTAMAVALAVQATHPIIPGGWLGAAGFGLIVGAMGMIGDLAESLIKRDCGVKDAAQLIPSFGGVLDVIDAILFAAPVSYLWLFSTQPLSG